MPDMDAIALADQAVMIGLRHAGQAREAVADAEDGTLAALSRSLPPQGAADELADRAAPEERPDRVLLRRLQGPLPPRRGDLRPGLPGRAARTRGRPVAVKVLRNRFVTDPAAVKRFNQEAESGMKLRHPNIVRILDYGEEDKRHYMIMEYVEGSNLRDFLKIRGRLSQKDALPLILGPGPRA